MKALPFNTRWGRQRPGFTQREIPSAAEVKAAQTPAGGWTKAQLAMWGISWPPPPGWRKALESAQ